MYGVQCLRKGKGGRSERCWGGEAAKWESEGGGAFVEGDGACENGGAKNFFGGSLS